MRIGLVAGTLALTLSSSFRFVSDIRFLSRPPPPLLHHCPNSAPIPKPAVAVATAIKPGFRSNKTRMSNAQPAEVANMNDQPAKLGERYVRKVRNPAVIPAPESTRYFISNNDM